MNKTLSSHLGELKNKGKSSWVIQKVAGVADKSSCLREVFIIYKFKSQFKQGFPKEVITRAGRLRECSQGQL